LGALLPQNDIGDAEFEQIVNCSSTRFGVMLEE
jgi:hypothetical protein